MPEINNNIEQRSEFVQEIIGSVPGFLMRSGITVIFFVVFILIFSSFFFKYPDIVSGRLVLTGENPPADIIPKISGKLKNIYVIDKQQVGVGELIAEIENPAVYEDILFLKEILNNVSEIKDFREIMPLNKLKLGELQSDYSALLKNIKDYNYFIELKYYPSKIEIVKKRISVYNKVHKNSINQFEIISADLKLSQKKYNRDSILYNDKVIPDAEFEKSKSELIQKKISVETIKNNVSNIELQIVNLEQEFLDLQLKYLDENKKFESTLIEQSDNLKAKIELWEQNYILKSPINGCVSFSDIWSKNQNITSGEIVFSIIPKGKTKLLGHVQMSVVGAGKIKTGQKVNIRFDDFQQNEYGIVYGKVESISAISRKDFYSIIVIFPDSLKTSYGKYLPFIQNMNANADIITEELPLIVRFVNPLKSIFKN